MYKEGQLYVAHSAEGPIHIIGKMANRHGLIAGATGTGKTECSKRIADFVFKDAKKTLILDMNSYKDGKIGASAIKGHPEGYVNSEKGTDFTRFLKNNKNGIIVLDEFEKADKEVRELFMTMLDEGSFKDALGNVYDLSSRKNVEEIQRMIRIFKINEEQNMKTKLFALKNLATFKLVTSNN